MNYAGDTTPYVVGNTRRSQGKTDFFNRNYFYLASYNQMVGNANKCQLLTTQKNNLLSLQIGNDRRVNRETVKVLGVTFDKSLDI